jgi:hypothetical protein
MRTWAPAVMTTGVAAAVVGRMALEATVAAASMASGQAPLASRVAVTAGTHGQAEVAVPAEVMGAAGMLAGVAAAAAGAEAAEVAAAASAVRWGPVRAALLRQVAAPARGRPAGSAERPVDRWATIQRRRRKR